MKATSCSRLTSRARRPGTQRGDILIEALVGTALLGILFGGLNHALNKSFINQRYMNTVNIGRLELHNRLSQDGIENMCTSGSVSTASLAGKAISYSASCQTSGATLSIGSGLSVALPTTDMPVTGVTLASVSSTATQALFGGDGVVSLSY